jgi:hypothetical protein
LKLATVLGTQVIVGLDSKEGDIVLYFDSNLRLSPGYLRANNLYSNKELNADSTVKGYFSSNGRVKCQKFRGELSNGYVVPLESLKTVVNIPSAALYALFVNGIEFTHIDGVEICSKYITPNTNKYNRIKYKDHITLSPMFKPHWNTKQLMREYLDIPPGMVWIEEKIHGTSGRTGNVLVTVHRKWYQFWKPKTWQEWRIISGTRRMTHIDGHISHVRKETHNKLAPHLRKGETVYFEIFGHDSTGKEIQSGFSYGCVGGEYKVILYRVTITTQDGYSVDLPRDVVYRRADELGLMSPTVLYFGYERPETICETAKRYIEGQSVLDHNTLKEGVVVWYMDIKGNWNCLKHKNPSFLEKESLSKDVEEKCDVEDLI